MKAIMISIKPKWCAKIMNGEKTIEVRKNKALASAIQKLIYKYGYADIYVYCSKDKQGIFKEKYNGYVLLNQNKWIHSELNGKVLFKFRCYKVEEITPQMWTPEIEHDVLGKSCLKEHELFDYVCSYDGTEDKPFYVIHISDLEIFGRPKELMEFKIKGFERIKVMGSPYGDLDSVAYHYEKKPILKPLTKAPQNFCYVEVE